tara:strand:+ start:165 stop:611 length:447 start_codon:yes stop_codon:yes gene_type:complete
MNTLNKILAKIAPKDKTELSTQKVELGAIDDARDIISNFNKGEKILKDIEQDAKTYMKEYVNLTMKIDKFKDTAKTIISSENDVKNIHNLVKRGDTVLKKISTQAKELGVSVDDIKEWEELFDFSQFLSTKINEVDKLITEVKAISKN